MRRNIRLLWVIVAVFFMTACGVTENSGSQDIREVSSEVRTMGWMYVIEPKESGVVYEDAPVEFADPVVEEMLRNMIGKPEGEVYISDLQEIHAIYTKSDVGYWSDIQTPEGPLIPRGKDAVGPWETKQMETLEDLKYCYNLQYLCLKDIELPSLEPLKELPQLERMDLGSELSEERMKELSEITTLKGIEFGEIEWNPDVLAQMTSMERLDINYATDMSFLEYMPNLKKLGTYCCTPENWEVLVKLENLEHFEICGNMYTEIEVRLEELQAIPNLDYLELTFTSINKEYKRDELVEALPNLTGLVSLLGW